MYSTGGRGWNMRRRLGVSPVWCCVPAPGRTPLPPPLGGSDADVRGGPAPAYGPGGAYPPGAGAYPPGAGGRPPRPGGGGRSLSDAGAGFSDIARRA